MPVKNPPGPALLATLLCVLLGPSVEAAPRDPPCSPQPATIRYLQAALDGWDLVTRRILRLPPEGLPWMVLFDRGCAYHLAADRHAELGQSLDRVGPGLVFGIRAVEISTTRLAADVALPNGARIPLAGVAFASLYEREGALLPFFVVALPDVWASDPAYRDDSEDDWPGFVLHVLTHEMVHTRQLAAIAGRAEGIHARIPGLPASLDDDLVQNRFARVPGFEATVRAEIALLFQAATETDEGLATELARRAVDLTRARRSTYYGTDHEAWSAMEDLFLNMEGVACWAAYRRILESNPRAVPSAVLDDLRDNRKWWSQEHGLALFLALHRFSRGWVESTFPPELASPLDLLDRALPAGRPR